MPVRETYNPKKKTVNSSSTDKYILQAFRSGDPNGIDDIFKSDNKQKSYSDNANINCTLIELRSALQSALSRISDLEKNEKVHVMRDMTVNVHNTTVTFNFLCKNRSQ